MSTRQKVNESAAQRKLREAQELVKAAKKKEQEAWRAKWEAQRNDPEYIAKQALLAERREERSRKMAIGEENAQLARRAKLMDLVDSDRLPFIAYHEAGHAVIHTLVGNGISEATIIPCEHEKDAANSDNPKISLGHVSAWGLNFPIPEYNQKLIHVVTLLAGGMATMKAYHLAGIEVDEDELGTGSDDAHIDEIIESMHLDQDAEDNFRFKAINVCLQFMTDESVWGSIEDVKEALLTYKKIPGTVVRAIIRKDIFPDLFPLTLTKQLSFHYRKEFFTSYGGTAPYSLGIGDNHWGFTLSAPQYLRDFEKANAQVPKPEVRHFGKQPAQLTLDLSADYAEDQRAEDQCAPY